MNDPEKAVAILAINLIAERRKRPMKSLFELWSSRTRVEELATIVLDHDNLPIEPYITYVVGAIVAHYDKLSSNSALPTEKQILDFLAASGGISQILLNRMSRDVS